MTTTDPSPTEEHTRSVTARIRARYPDAPAALVERCVDDAVDRYRHARVQRYVPVLVERSAVRALVTALPDLEPLAPEDTGRDPATDPGETGR